MSDTLFCRNCGANVPYHVEYVMLTQPFNGTKYSYMGHKTVCRKCGSPIFNPAYNQSNVESLLHAVRRAEENLLIYTAR